MTRHARITTGPLRSPSAMDPALDCEGKPMSPGRALHTADLTTRRGGTVGRGHLTTTHGLLQYRLAFEAAA